MLIIGYWESFAGKGVDRQTCQICGQSVVSAPTAVKHYLNKHNITLIRNSRLAAWVCDD